MMLKRALGTLSGSVALVASFALARPALACSYPQPPPELRGAPSDGQQNVPTDVVPVFDMSRLALGEDPVTFSLRTAAGDEVGFSVADVANWQRELRPRAALEPNTDYIIEAHASYGGAPVTVSLAFATGAGPLAEAPHPPSVLLQHYEFAPDVAWSDCDMPRGTCVAVGEGALYELSHDGGVAPEAPYLINGPFATDFSGIDGIRCLSLRLRALNGTYSEPTRICLDSASSYVLAGDTSMTCTNLGIVHGGVLALTQGPIVEPSADVQPNGDEISIPIEGGSYDVGSGAESAASDSRANAAAGCNLRAPVSPLAPAALTLAFTAWIVRRRRAR
jgi:hypothetical protein